jgi:perosamine synthetase
MSDLNHCLAALKEVVGSTQNQVALHEPQFLGNEWSYVKACLDSGWVSSVGQYVSLFEQKIAEYTQIPYVVATVNGTSALHLSLVLMDVRQNDEVLIPALTFVATANAVKYCHAIPHFIEASEKDFGVDVEKLEAYLTENTIIDNGVCFNRNTGRRIQAIVPVHIFGHPGNLSALKIVASKFHIKVIEDASESLGSFYQGKHTGTMGDIAVLSFNGNKIITTGGGGAILTCDPLLAQKAKHLSTTAKRAHAFEFYHDELGYNYRLPNLNAALGCAQMDKLPEKVAQKRKLASRYLAAFSKVPGVRILKEPLDAQSNYWLNALILDEEDKSFVENFIGLAAKLNIQLRALWTPLHLLPMYQDCPSMALSITESHFARVISLPSSPHLELAHG